MRRAREERPKILWAPWRAGYVQQSRGSGCIFCEATGWAMSAETLVLWRGEGVYVMMNRYPYASGHVLVSPYRHVNDLDALSEEEAMELIVATRDTIRVLKGSLAPEGFNVGINLGKVAGAGYADHLHVHVVPRWNGDHNFMPVIAGAKVISEHLLVTYAKLRDGFDRLGTGS